MSAGLKPYSGMKDSGALWLGCVPIHWDVMKLARVVRGSNAGEVIDKGWWGRGQEILYTCARNRLKSDYAAFPAWKRTAANDLLLTRNGTPYVHRPVEGAIYSNVVQRIALTAGANREWIAYSLEESARGMSGYGVSIESLNYDMWKVLPILRPPPDEQRALVRFLDHADRRIRRYIAAKRKLIALLNEQKQAIIHKAVTRGLEPNVKFKPSGVRWIGEVPAHWDERPAKYFYREVDERSTAGEEELLSVSHLTGVTPRSAKNITMFMAASYVGHKLCRHDDLVINTMWAWMGALGVSSHTGIVSPAYAVYRPLKGSRLRPAYADLLLRTSPYVSEYICRSTGIQSSRLRLYPEQFLRIKIACPPESEQEAMLNAIAGLTGDADRAISATTREIDLLREYRTRLIADVVTGKLDVREAASKLPEEIQDQEPVEADADSDAEPADLETETELAEAEA